MNEIILLLQQPESYIALLTLTLMEIVLGIDNVVFISIVAGRLRPEQQAKARNLGLILGLLFRVILLFCISWIASLTAPVLTVLNHGISGRDLILLGGGLFLIAKSTKEIHHKMEGEDEQVTTQVYPSFWSVVSQIIMLDIVFSFDSVITAVGLSKDFPIMVTAVVLSMFVMIASAGAISAFIMKHPALKMLALSFLLMIGMMLVAESFHIEIPKGYVYFAMAFSIFVEMLNMKSRKGSKAH